MKKCKTSRFKNIAGYEETETGISVKWETWFCKTFGAKWMNEDIMSKSYDAELNGQNIDIKASDYYIREFKRGKPWNGGGIWSFKQNAFKKPEIDFYACICIKDNKPQKILLVPSDVYESRKGLCVGKQSKFDIYNILQNA